VHRSVIALLIGTRIFKIVTRFRHGVADQGVLFAIGDVTGRRAQQHRHVCDSACRSRARLAQPRYSFQASSTIGGR